jgi:hypothetical protein
MNCEWITTEKGEILWNAMKRKFIGIADTLPMQLSLNCKERR